MPTCRLLPTWDSPGATNMALDEALLRSALERNVASLRFYTWSEPTLSLGYFQKHTERLPGVAWVRRPTGGDAILHHHELTYCLALPAGPPWHTGESWLCRMHHAIGAALRRLGVETNAVVCGEERRLGPFLCFQHQTPADLRIAGHKIVGSAQRRPHGAMMQHGSILVRTSPFAPDLPGIAELSGVTVGLPDLEWEIAAELVKETGWTFEPTDWTEEERRTAAELEREKYATAAWNEKR
jgi:lipoyl(octanoyl) transferase